MIPKPLAWGIVVVITVIWAGNAVARVFVEGYTSDPWINWVFSGVVTSMMTLKQNNDGVLGRIVAAVRNTPGAPPSEPPDGPGGGPM